MPAGSAPCVSRTKRGYEILRRIESTLSKWRKVGAALGMTKQELDQFAEAFEHPEREAARKAIKHCFSKQARPAGPVDIPN